MGSIAVAVLLRHALATVPQSPEVIIRFDLPTQGPGSAHRVFGEVSHQQIIFAEATMGTRRQAAVGNLTPVRRLIACSLEPT